MISEMEVSGRRRPTLLQHMSMVDSSNLGDLFRARDGDDVDHRRRNTLADLTLAAVLGGADNRRSPPTTRTLLDIIKEEQSSAAASYSGQHHQNQNKKSWKSFKELLRNRRDPTTSTTTTHSPSATGDHAIQISAPIISSSNTRATPENVSDVNINATTSTVVMRLSAALEAEREEQRQVQTSPPPAAAAEEEQSETVAAVAVVAPPQTETPALEGERVSLMELLEETDRDRMRQREMVVVVGPTTEEEEAEEEEDGKREEEEGGRKGRKKEEYVCCVCMVRHKGAAFIPCGHTFCRVCSRELWVSRGNCPLCNGYILEILDIF